MPVIKRYSNRKLYDTEAKRYVTLERIADLIRKGEDVHVVDHDSGEDITAMIQAQVIFEQERRLRGGLPRTVLTSLIQTGSDTLNNLRRALVTPGDWIAQVDAEIERRIHILIRQKELSQDEGLRLLEKLTGVGESTPGGAAATQGEVAQLLKRHGVPTRDDMDALTRKVEALTAELAKRSRAQSGRRKSAK